MLKIFDLSDFTSDYISALAKTHGVDESTFLEMMVQEHLIMSLADLDKKAERSDLDCEEERLMIVLDSRLPLHGGNRRVSGRG